MSLWCCWLWKCWYLTPSWMGTTAFPQHLAEITNVHKNLVLQAARLILCSDTRDLLNLIWRISSFSSTNLQLGLFPIVYCWNSAQSHSAARKATSNTGESKLNWFTKANTLHPTDQLCDLILNSFPPDFSSFKERRRVAKSFWLPTAEFQK